jgi:hypothetical protein
MKTVEFRNDGGKLAKQLLRLVDSSKGRNFQDTHISVDVLNDSIIVSTFCATEYGRAWCNQNHTRVEKSDIPFFAAKKLGIV